MSLTNWLERKFAIPDGNTAEQADVIIGIGIDVSSNGQDPSCQSLNVSYRCQELFLHHRGQNIIFTGGYSHNNGPCEAQAMYNAMAFPSIPRNNVFLEIDSTRTWENADNTLRIMRQHNWHTAIVVAQQGHARRVRATFRRRWRNSGRRFIVVKAWSPYRGGSQKRLNSFWHFSLWNTAAWLYSKLKGYV